MLHSWNYITLPNYSTSTFSSGILMEFCYVTVQKLHNVPKITLPYAYIIPLC